MSALNPLPASRIERPRPEINYPTTDGKPMAETDPHIQLMVDLRHELKERFRSDTTVYVGANLLLYYVEGDPRQRVAPDIFVARGVGAHERRVYKLWEEGRAPDVVIEISSKSTCLDDVQRKWGLYQRLGVAEYFICDPEHEYLDEPLVGYRWQNGQYVELEIIDGCVMSEALGLELVYTNRTLRLRDPQTGQFLLTPAETEAALQTAEAEVARLRAELARLTQP